MKISVDAKSDLEYILELNGHENPLLHSMPKYKPAPGSLLINSRLFQRISPEARVVT